MAGVGAGVGVGGGRVGSARGVPHSPQNLSSGAHGAPHEPHVNSSFAPHSTQNFRPSRFSWPQDGQSTVPHRPFRMRIRQWCVKIAALSTWPGQARHLD